MAPESSAQGSDDLPDTIVAGMRHLTSRQRRRLASVAVQGLSHADRKALGEELNHGLRAPDRSTADTLWVVVVVAFAVVLVGSFVTIAASVFVGTRDNATVQTVLSLFTAVVGFLGGLFAPTPAAARGGQITTQTSAPADSEIQTDVHGPASATSAARPAAVVPPVATTKPTPAASTPAEATAVTPSAPSSATTMAPEPPAAPQGMGPPPERADAALP